MISGREHPYSVRHGIFTSFEVWKDNLFDSRREFKFLSEGRHNNNEWIEVVKSWIAA
jgi:hypothetical protein